MFNRHSKGQIHLSESHRIIEPVGMGGTSQRLHYNILLRVGLDMTSHQVPWGFIQSSLENPSSIFSFFKKPEKDIESCSNFRKHLIFRLFHACYIKLLHLHV